MTRRASVTPRAEPGGHRARGALLETRDHPPGVGALPREAEKGRVAIKEE